MVIADWWMGLDIYQRILWSVAIVSSILLFILMVLSLYGHEAEPEEGRERKRSRLIEPKTILMAFTCLGWVGLLAYSLTGSLQFMLIFSVLAAVLGAFLPWWVGPYLRRGPFDMETVRASTGKVLRSVPPHRNGFGKVHLNMRAAPFKMDAVTAGEELPPGATIRVVEIIDDRVLLVEAVHKSGESTEKGPLPRAPEGPPPRGIPPR